MGRRRVRCTRAWIVLSLGVATAAAQGSWTPPSLVAAQLGAVPWNTQAGSIAAFDVKVDDTGAVESADIVQDVAPYGTMLGCAIPSWRFEPAREGGVAVTSPVLVLGFFRPPLLNFAGRVVADSFRRSLDRDRAAVDLSSREPKGTARGVTRVPGVLVPGHDLKEGPSQ